MSRRRRAPVTPLPFQPPMPERLCIYSPGEWEAPPLDGTGAEWEAGHREAYQKFEAARRDWYSEYGHLPVDESQRPGPAPFCGEMDTDHECLGAECPWRPAGRDVGFAPRERRREDECDD